ncbi:hypothetical protein [Rhizobium lentis]|uniref:Uncharacterized protein n=1 Tax=Rhizobium lentis TaxID=1138194 RepID=A0A9Q3M854_9HYPH|nr:hypothetical protein [Rhizobium lentis]MBX4957395.1 hypothetical protein [Rhizobium lentis]MBX4975028.1 hypothetical protein [Rhizobium lentis]MBX4987386.1 hypothetical protein [Rhizobium lentis]MBX4997350.1 hypothetical protein [Rhizobium lentis]MBX5005830.1 hypothetical protein [Rhizobium lentis]
MRRYRCVCEECDPLPPIEGLHPETFEGPEPERRLSALFQSLTDRIVPARRPS